MSKIQLKFLNTFLLISLDTAFKQQRLASWQPILTPEIVIALFLILGIIFVPIGTALKRISDGVRNLFNLFYMFNLFFKQIIR